MEWIKVSERLPEIRELVIVGHLEDEWVCAGQRYGKNGYWYNQFADATKKERIYPTHWMPLPPPPTES